MSAQFVQSASEYEPRPSDTRLDMEDILVIPNATKKRSASSQSLKSVATPSEQKWNRDASDINALPFETNEIVDLSQLAVDNPVRSTLPLKAEQSEKPKDSATSQEPISTTIHGAVLAERGSLEDYAEPKAWTPRDPYHFQPPLQQPEGEAWEIIKGGIAKYDKEMCDAWNGELDTLLTFTGLFSAAATSFCVDSFGSLSRNASDTTNALLFAISAQLANSSSPPANGSLDDRFTPAKHDVYINVLYFVSLTLALSVSAICILGKQWIREYQKDIVGSACNIARVRQLRFDSVEAWRVPQIIAALPVVLLASLLLFFAGILIQLWHVTENTTAVAVSVVVALTVLCVLITTVAPASSALRISRAAFVPFRSPQSWMCLRVLQSLVYPLLDRHDWLPPGTLLPASNWTDFDLKFLEWKENTSNIRQDGITSLHRVFQWVLHILGGSSNIEKAALWCLQTPETHPPDLVSSQEDLLRYGLGGASHNNPNINIDRALYSYSAMRHGHQDIGSTLGQYQVELLLRSLHQNIVNLNTSDHTGGEKLVVLLRDFMFLSHHMHSPANPSDEIMPSEGMQTVQESSSPAVPGILLDQFALVLQQWMDANDEDWYSTIGFLVFTHRQEPTAFLSHVNYDTIHHRIPKILRKSKSISLTYEAGRKAVSSITWFDASSHWFPAIDLFIRIDKVMVELCNNNSELFDGERVTRESMEEWFGLRTWIIGESRRKSVKNRRPDLSDDFFDTHNGSFVFRE